MAQVGFAGKPFLTWAIGGGG